MMEQKKPTHCGTKFFLLGIINGSVLKPQFISCQIYRVYNMEEFYYGIFLWPPNSLAVVCNGCWQYLYIKLYHGGPILHALNTISHSGHKMQRKQCKRLGPYQSQASQTNTDIEQSSESEMDQQRKAKKCAGNSTEPQCIPCIITAQKTSNQAVSGLEYCHVFINQECTYNLITTQGLKWVSSNVCLNQSDPQLISIVFM